MLSPKATRRQRLIGEPSPVELRRVINDLVDDVRALRVSLEEANKRIAALEAGG